jgi:hypothetical protein
MELFIAAVCVKFIVNPEPQAGGARSLEDAFLVK